jgi:hypothetical protein
MKFDDYVQIQSEHDRLEREYRAAVDLLVTVGPRATELEYLVLKTSVEDVRYDLEYVRQKLQPARVSSVKGKAATGV